MAGRPDWRPVSSLRGRVGLRGVSVDPLAPGAGVGGFREESHKLLGALRRLHAEWRAAAIDLRLRNNSSYSDVIRALDVDRGTAQRLLRVLRIADVEVTDLPHFPGVRAWYRVILGVESALSPDPYRSQCLQLAVDQFAEALRESGGSKQAAIREVQRSGESEGIAHGGAVSTHYTAGSQGAGYLPRPEGSMTPAPSLAGMSGEGGRGGAEAPKVGPVGAFSGERLSARTRWVLASADVVGYLTEYRLHTQFFQPCQSNVRKYDFAWLDAFKGCRGTPNAAPFVLGRTVYPEELDNPPAKGQKGMHVLQSLTSQPPPLVSQSSGRKRQTVFVEFPWDSMTGPIDLAVLNIDPGNHDAPAPPEDWLTGSLLNRHPARRLILERVVPLELDREFSASFRVFRTETGIVPGGPWYDRLEEPAPLRRLGRIDHAIANEPEPFGGYRQLVLEALDRLEWDTSGLVLYRVEIDDPIPFAKYSVIFERNPVD